MLVTLHNICHWEYIITLEIVSSFIYFSFVIFFSGHVIQRCYATVILSFKTIT